MSRQSRHEERPPEHLDELKKKRRPGLDGTYRDTCIICLRPTDTVLGAEGEPEWHAAMLAVLGMPQDEAIATVQYTSERIALDGERRYLASYRLCRKCAAKHPRFPRPALVMVEEPVPTITQPPAQ